MKGSAGSRDLLAVCCTLAVLLAVLAAVQYRWSGRVAAADAQREREHLDTSASLFANEFNAVGSRTIEFVQTDAWTAVKSSQPLGSLPKLIAELYYVEVPVEGPAKVKRLIAGGLFEPVPTPEWMPSPRCTAGRSLRPSRSFRRFTTSNRCTKRLSRAFGLSARFASSRRDALSRV